MKKLFLPMFVGICILATTNAREIKVPVDHGTIQAAIEAAVEGDTVVVEEGIYLENINFLGKAITVASRFILDGDTAHISKTIIDGSQGSNPDKASTVLFISGEDTTSVLSGFTITGGSGTLVNTGGGYIDLIGGGIVTSGSGAKITHNIIEGNRISYMGNDHIPFGAGLAARVDHNHTLIVRKNIVRNNFVEGNWAYGGGMAVMGGSIIVENNQIINNQVKGNSVVAGAGLCWANLSFQGTIEELIIRNNLISGNIGTGSGSPTGGGGGIFFGLAYSTGIPEIYNNIIANNSIASPGGGISLWAGNNLVYNNTIYENRGAAGSNHLNMNQCNATLFNNILWTSADNRKTGISFFPGNSNSLYASHNLFDALAPDNRITSIGNLVADPVFTPESYELEEYSPGIGRGIDSVQLNSAWQVIAPRDYLGNPRPNPIDTLVDLGAIESPYEGNVFIPDTVFLHALIEEGVDTNGDSLISYAEAEATTKFEAFGWPAVYGRINDVTGIEAFINLDTLELDYNLISEIDLSNNTALVYLNLGSTKISNVDISNCTKLQHLIIGGSGTLAMNTNLLTSLDLSKNTALTYLNCHGNELTYLDVSNNPKLEKLFCGDNLLASIDISNNYHLRSISLSGMKTLTQVCVWQTFFADSVNIEINTTDSKSSYFTTECTIGIEETNLSGLTIYPNPTNSLLTIETEYPGHYSINITTLNGQQILTGEMEGTTHQIDLSSFQKGAYFITIRSDDFVSTRKIIKL